MQYDMRPDRTGWTVFEVATDKPVMLDDLVLSGSTAMPLTRWLPFCIGR
jgi:hypothetical protein